MGQFFVIHPENPPSRLIRQAAKIIQDGGVVIYPTDTGYAIGCQLANKSAIERIRQIRQLDDTHHFTLICRDLSDLSTYAIVDNTTFRSLKAHTPGPFTFILKASSEIPKRLLHPKRKTIGIRVPDNRIVHALLDELKEPLMSVSLILPGESYPFTDPQDINEKLGKQVDLIIDGGPGSGTPTSIIDLVEGVPQILRIGKGDVGAFR